MVLLAIAVVPYVFGRVASQSRCISVNSAPNAKMEEGQAQRLQLRVACYNIAHGRGLATSNWEGGGRTERIARLDGIAELLRNIDADVVVLNEVDFDSSWSYSVNHAKYLASKAGYPHWVEQRNLDFQILLWKWRFGNAVLSKYPIEAARVLDLPSYSTWETIVAGKKRGVVCEIVVQDQLMQIVGTHLSHRSESLRVDSAEVLANTSAGSSLPTVIAGDLNSTPPGFPHSASEPRGKNAIAVLDGSECFHRSPMSPPTTDDQLTFHSAEPRSVIDWVLIPLDWRFLDYRVEQSSFSDHRPVYADLTPVSTLP